MLKRLFPVIILCFIYSQYLYSQSDPLDQILTNLQVEETEIAEWLQILTEQPVNINGASKELLEKIPFLTDQHIEKILKNRPFAKKTQIAKVLGTEVYRNIRPFITVLKTKSYPKILISHRLQYTFEKNRALNENIFLGSPLESYSRIRLQFSANLSAGFLMQKDIGEKNYFDHYSAFIAWKFRSFPLKFVFGNYYVRQAEGLLLSSPFSLPKSAHILNTSSGRQIAVSPFLSSNEADGFWGCAAEYGSGNNIKFLLFYSQIARDGVKSEDWNGVSGLYRSGYHRTNSELENENTLIEKSIGGTINIPFYLFQRFGISVTSISYSLPFMKKLSENERRRKYYNFYGSGLTKYSMFYSLKLNQGIISGEMIPEASGKITQIHSFNLGLTNWQFLLKWWHIPRSFQSPFGRAVANSNPFPSANQGILAGGSGEPTEKLFITFYWYHDKDLWRTYFSDRPLKNKDFYLQTKYQLDARAHILLQYNYYFDQFIPAEMNTIINKRKYRLRFQFERKFGTLVRFRSRLEMVFLDFSKNYASQKGINFYQDFYWQITKRITGQIRFSSFNSDEYDSRIYEYESDLPGVFSNYALYGKGTKWYIMLSVKLFQNFRMLAKFRKIVYDGVDSIGSGLTSISGDKRQDIHVQLEFKY